MGYKVPNYRGGGGMFVELMCSCSASISVEVEKSREDAGWLLVSRFAAAHIACGLVSPLLEEEPNPTKPFNINVTPEQDTP